MPTHSTQNYISLLHLHATDGVYMFTYDRRTFARNSSVDVSLRHMYRCSIMHCTRHAGGTFSLFAVPSSTVPIRIRMAVLLVILKVSSFYRSTDAHKPVSSNDSHRRPEATAGKQIYKIEIHICTEFVLFLSETTKH